MLKKTQADHVLEDKMNRPLENRFRVQVPGIESLHTRTAPELAATLAMIVKAHSNIVELKYVIGQYIEVTTQ